MGGGRGAWGAVKGPSHMLEVAGEVMHWWGGTMRGCSPIPAPPGCPNLQKTVPVSIPIPDPPPAVPGLCALLPSSSSPVPYLAGVQSAEAVWPLPGLGLAIKSRGQAEGVTRNWELLAGESRGGRVGFWGVLSVGCCCYLWAAAGILPGSHRAQSWIWPLHHEFWTTIFEAQYAIK